MSDKMIRFIDSEYRELFQIPDGASIRITYPPGDGRGTITRACAYLDEYHTKVGGEVLHTCQLAEMMERLGAKYEPAEQLQGVMTVPFSEEERSFFDVRSDAGKTRIAIFSGDFGNQGDRFHAGFHVNEPQAEKHTPAFQAEVHSAVYALRQELLGSRAAMIAHCHAHPEAKLLEDSRFSQYGFKLDTETRRYFILCHVPEFERDARFSIYAYEKTAPLREIQPGEAGDRLMFYRNDAESGRCVGYLRGDFGRDGHSFYHQWFDQTKSENTLEFKDEFHEIMTLLRRDILSDLSSSTDYCYNHPQAKLPDRDGYNYGFKLETETRQYFVRCTTLRNDNFYVYAYNKDAPAPEQQKSSVLGQIREAQVKPRTPKDAGEHKQTRSTKEPER